MSAQCQRFGFKIISIVSISGSYVTYDLSIDNNIFRPLNGSKDIQNTNEFDQNYFETKSATLRGHFITNILNLGQFGSRMEI